MNMQRRPVNKKFSFSNINRKLIIKILFGVLGFLVLSVGALVAIALGQYHSIKSDPLKVLSQNKQVVSNAAAQPGSQASAGSNPEASAAVLEKITVDGKEYTAKEGMVNILFCGIDYMSDRQGIGERSDMLMICAVDATDKKATLISIPRDMRALVTKIDPKTGGTLKEEYNKINTAFSLGGGADYCYANTMKCVSSLVNLGAFHTNISYYAGLNIDGIPQIADAIGGVSLKLDADFPGIGSKGATVNLKGQNAIDYVRERHEFASGDIARSEHQQQFMMALAKKIQKMGAADSILKLYDQITKYMNTNMNTDEIVAFATILDQVKIDSIEHITLPGEWKSPFIWPNEAGIKEIMLKTYYNAV